MKYNFEIKSNTITAYSSNKLNIHHHLHNNLELVYVSSGNIEAIIEDKSYTVHKGQFLIIFPYQLHIYHHTSDLNVIILNFPVDLLPTYGSLFSSKVPAFPIFDDINNGAKQLIELFFNKYLPASPEIAHGFIHNITSILLSETTFIDIKKTPTNTLKNMLIFCNENYMEPISINDVADELHISTSRISHIFKEKLHTTFTEYITKKRIDHACTILESSQYSVTETAYSSGFSSIRTFNRMFTKYMKMSPQKYIHLHFSVK